MRPLGCAVKLEVDMISDAFYVSHDPDLWKAQRWAADVCRVRVIETPVGGYGALDQGFGTTYFDVGDWLLKLKAFRQIVVVGGGTIQELEEEGDDELD